MSGPEDRSLRELMTGNQTEEQRRQIYAALTRPIVLALVEHLQSYLQQLYRVTPRQQGSEQVKVCKESMPMSLLRSSE